MNPELPPPKGHPETVPREQFPPTQWTQVQLAARAEDSDAGRAALEALCGRYWPAIYGYLRRAGHASADAEDLTQGFFATLLEDKALLRADREGGHRFRSFLLAILKRFRVDQFRHADAQKRGRGKVVLACDFAEVERQYLSEADSALSPEAVYDRRWAAALLAAARQDLERELEKAGQGARFAELKRFLLEAGNAATYAPVAARLGISGDSVVVAVSRLRERFRELVWRQVQATVAATEEVPAEWRHLFR